MNSMTPFRVYAYDVIIAIRPAGAFDSRATESAIKDAFDGWPKVSSDTIYEGDDPTIQYWRIDVVSSMTIVELHKRVGRQLLLIKARQKDLEAHIMIMERMPQQQVNESWITIKATI